MTNFITDDLIYANSIARYYITGTPGYAGGGNPVPFNQLDYNTGGGFELTSTDGEFECKFTGKVRVDCQLVFTADVGAGNVALIFKNGSLVSQGPENSSGTSTNKTVYDTFEVETGDIIEVRHTNTGTLSGNIAYCYIVMQRVAQYSAGEPAGFALATATKAGLVKSAESGSIVLTNSGSDNINTTVYYARVGKLVTISWTGVTFDSSTAAVSDAFLPTTIVDSALGEPFNVVALSGNPTIGYRVNINHANRTIGFGNFDMTTTGNQSVAGTTCPAASISWVLP